MNEQLTADVKAYCRKLGADIVGIAPAERWANAPIERSPLGLMPAAKSVVVCGFHYLDACVELSENDDIRLPGASVSNHVASGHAMWTMFKLAKNLERRGYKAIPIAVTLWWNYRTSPGAARGFSSDLTHYYAAVAAGLGEIGWSNICLTPEYGPRQRLISLITDAPLAPDPLYTGDPLCDGCLQCAKRCPTQAFTKEVNGMLTVDFGERQFTFPNKNLWRCAAGENFNLDVLADWPEEIDEAVVCSFGRRAAIEDPGLRYGWKMGLCLKYCVPKSRRYYDKNYAPSPRRRRDAVRDTGEAALAETWQKITAHAQENGVDFLAITDANAIKASGADPGDYLPNAKSALLVGQSYSEGNEGDSFRMAGRNALWIAKILQDTYGFDTLIESGVDAEAVSKAAGFEPGSERWCLASILTDMPCPQPAAGERRGGGSGFQTVQAKTLYSPTDLKQRLHELATASGADLFGVAPVSRLDAIADQLTSVFGGAEYFCAYEQGWGPKSELPTDMRGRPANPGIRDVSLTPKRAASYLPGATAKSVIVIGLALLSGSVENAGKPPARKAGHFGAFIHQESLKQNDEIALKIVKALEANGHRAKITRDLEGLASENAGTLMPDLKANRFPAIAAGLGEPGRNGLVLTPDFGSKVRFVAVVTDAELPADDVYRGKALCTGCGSCVNACPVQAISANREYEIEAENRRFKWSELDLLRCDWAMRYGLVGAEGPAYIGSSNDFPPPEKITKDSLISAIKAADQIQKVEYCPIVERCFTECPLNR
ncbi:MAG: 4Fe-4S binding protein [Clostridiales Family XIII bacterium]|jgi:epoxyqueuosine reductase QueG|nr:4Fe-4S binding protein [Clostridiales Family XIII bacterium]